MEDPLLTAAHYARVVDRREALRAASAALLAGRPDVVLEVGCGHGHFLNAFAEAHPATLCLGLDIIAERIERANRKKNRARLPNLHFLHASAGDFLMTLPADAQFAAVFVLFPDPWPKRRHHKNRLMQGDFLTEVARRAGQGMRLYFRTDDSAYFTAAATTVRAHSDWEIVDEPWGFEFETVFQQRAAGFHSMVARPKARSA